MICYLGIGSNINPYENIQASKLTIEENFKQSRFSKTYESKAVGFDGDNFLNLVAEIHYAESLQSLIDKVKKIEDQLGRVRGVKRFSSRHIDIDILLYGHLVCQKPIILPRPEIFNNAYVLCPLAELAPDMIEPDTNLTYDQLWQNFDKNKQKLILVND